jgi:hypothetical protein
MNENLKRLESRVVSAAEATLAEKNVVSAIDVLMRIGWLTQARLDEWRQGRLRYLEAGISANLHKISAAMAMFRRWARGRKLSPSETAYVSRTRDRHPLRFSVSGDRAIERAYRTHWVSGALSASKRESPRKQQSRAPDLVAILPLHDWTCSGCGGTDDFLLMQSGGPVCRTCAGLDHLVFLAAGDASLTRRAKQASGLCAVVVRFSRARKRHERQGVLVEKAALETAERTAKQSVDSLVD